MAEIHVSPAASVGRQIAEWLLASESAEPVQARRGRLLAAVLLFVELLNLIGLGLLLTVGSTGVSVANARLLFASSIGFSVLWLAVFFINRRGATAFAGMALATILLAFDLILVQMLGTLSPNALMLIVPIILAGFFAPPVSSVMVALMAGLGYLGLNLESDPAYLSHMATSGETAQTLVVYANMLFVASISWLFSRTTKQTIDESRDLSLALVTQREELERQLVFQTRQLQATTSVAHAVAGSRNLDQLLEDIVRLVSETFGYYHVQVFLVDESEGYAILRQSTGEVGQELLQRGHRLPVGSLSVIGQVTASGRPLIADDTDSDFVHRRNELLPNTRAEMAVPLMLGERVIGALDLQSTEPNAFGQEMLNTFQALADQLSVAIENARLFEQAEQNLRELKELSREASQRSWADFLAEARDEEKNYSHGPQSKGMQIQRSRVIERVLSAGTLIVSTGKDGRQTFLAAPIVVRNEVVGVLGIEPDTAREWSQDDLQLLQSIAERTALAIENARLYIQAQRAAEREGLINEIASRLQRAPSLAMLLESAARELAEAMGTENVYAEISIEKPLGHPRKQIGNEGETADVDDKAQLESEAPRSDASEEARA
jgi:GAF domain-containing protein